MKKNNRAQVSDIYARLRRIERKCNHILSSVAQRKPSPNQDEIDRLVKKLHTTAHAVSDTCSREKKLCDTLYTKRYGV